VNAPAATNSADAMVVFGSGSDARLSHDAAAAADARPEYQIAMATIGTTSTTVLTCCLILPILPLLPA
jgi:hypothetical protein